MFEKLLGTPYSHFTHQQVRHLLGEVLARTTEMKDKDWIVEAETVLKMGVTFESKIGDEDMKDRFLDCVLTQLRKIYRFRRQYQKAAELHELSKPLQSRLSDFRGRQLMESMRAEAWSLAGDHHRAIDIITKSISAGTVDSDNYAPDVPLPPEDWRLKAHLQFTYGRILDRAGPGWENEAIKQMEEAKALCLTFNYNGDDEGVNVGLCRLLQLYGKVDKHIESALSLNEMIKAIVSKPECRKDFKKSWILEEGLIWHEVGDHDGAEECWRAAAQVVLVHDDRTNEPDDEIDSEPSDDEADEPDDESNKFQRDVDEFCKEFYEKHQHSRCSECSGEHLRDPIEHWQTLFYVATLNWKHLDRAVAASEAAELVVDRRLGGESSRLVDVYMLRGSIFISHHQYEKAYIVYWKAITILQEMNQGDDEVRKRLSFCYGMQARQKLEMGDDLAGSLDLMKRAAPELEKENPGLFYYLQAMAHGMQEGKMQKAATWAEKASRELIKMQQFKPVGSRLAQMAWIRTFEESTLLTVFKFNEVLWACLGNFRNALIWAERSRTRLYMRITDQDQPSVDCPTSSQQFDFCYKHAEELLGDVLLMCGPDTAIISYSFSNHPGTNLFCYLAFKEGEHIILDFEKVDIAEHLPEWDFKEHDSKTLELLVDDALSAIRDTRKESEKDPKDRIYTKRAQKVLSILHSILIKPIQHQLRQHCKNLVISQPHGFLSKIPFSALYDETQGEFLIQQRTVCVVPSLRTLHRCFQRQDQFEKGWENLEPPFVAGNPDPMGAGEPPLSGAALEANAVANILDDAQLFSGEKMTKANVVQGLSKSRVVLLSTHGILKPQVYPHGALVLRGKLGASTSSSLDERAEEVLTPADIDKIGTIPAGLVVLSACESGLGKGTQAEGVLGLGRAVLQAGAVTTVLTLWKVLDYVTTDLITGMFKKLQLEGWTVPQSLQASMVDMILKGKTLDEWAPFIAMGSPKLRIRKASFEFKFISTITPDSKCKVLWKQQLPGNGVCLCDDC